MRLFLNLNLNFLIVTVLKSSLFNFQYIFDNNDNEVTININNSTQLITSKTNDSENQIFKSFKSLTNEEEIIQRFQEYLRIKSMHPDPDYKSCIKFLKQQADEIGGLEFQVLEFYPGKPIAIITWKGSNPDLPAIGMHSHTDVVSVYPEYWSHDPFQAVITENGNIYARGTQDMKGTGMQYLEAIRKLKEQNFQPTRTLHMLYLPDEEIGGAHGMEAFTKSALFGQEYKFAMFLGEGRPSPTNAYIVHYAERSVRSVDIHIKGNTGHGSRFIDNTAASKFFKLLSYALEYREQERKRLQMDPLLSLGDVTSINLTKLKGGMAFNIVPSEIECTLDIRVTPRINVSNFESLLKSWIAEISPDSIDEVTYKYHQRPTKPVMSPINPGNIWWDIIASTGREMNITWSPVITGGATDSRFLRELDIPAYGLSLFNETPLLSHDNNEFVNKDTFLKGIAIYERLLQKLLKTTS